jgi:Phage integrase family
MPGFGRGRSPRNKGLRFPADPPTVEEIVAVMRCAGDSRHGLRTRALIVVLWRAGLRISEALSPTESDLDHARGSILIRRGKGGRRREVGLDAWAWQHLNAWLEVRVVMRVGALLIPIAYEYSVGPICDGLNQEQQDLVANDNLLARRLRTAETPTAQRNAVLDSWDEVLDQSQYWLAQFEGLAVPDSLLARERTTQAAWSQIVGLIRGFVERLNAVTNATTLGSVVNALPPLRTTISTDGVTLAAGLEYLGGGHCMLDQPVTIPTVTLPGRGTTTVPRQVSPPATPTTVPPPVSPPTTSTTSVAPPVGPPTSATTTVAPPVGPPTSATTTVAPRVSPPTTSTTTATSTAP